MSAVAPSWLPRVAYAQSDDSGRDVMVSDHHHYGGNYLVDAPTIQD